MPQSKLSTLCNVLNPLSYKENKTRGSNDNDKGCNHLPTWPRLNLTLVPQQFRFTPRDELLDIAAHIN